MVRPHAELRQVVDAVIPSLSRFLHLHDFVFVALNIVAVNDVLGDWPIAAVLRDNPPTGRVGAVAGITECIHPLGAFIPRKAHHVDLKPFHFAHEVGKRLGVVAVFQFKLAVIRLQVVRLVFIDGFMPLDRDHIRLDVLQALVIGSVLLGPLDRTGQPFKERIKHRVLLGNLQGQQAVHELGDFRHGT